MTDWNKAIYTDPSQTPADHDTEGSSLNIMGYPIGDVAKSAARTVAQTFNPIEIVKGLGGTVKDVATHLYNGEFGDAASSAVMNPKELSDAAHDRAITSDNPYEAGFHHVMSVLPFLGPTGESIYNSLHEGIKNKNPEALGNGLGGMLSFAAPEALPLLKGSKLAQHLSETVMDSGANNYYKTMTPIKNADMVPQAQRTARQLAEGPAPVAGSRQGLIDKMEAGKQATGPLADAALDYNTTGREGPLQPLLGLLDKYGVDNYTNPKAGGGRVPRSVEGLNALQDLRDEIVGGAGGNNTPGLTVSGQTPPRQPVSKVALQTINNIRRDLENGTRDTQGNWREKIDPNSWKKMDRNHASILREYMDTEAPDINEINKTYRMYSKAKDFMQEAANGRMAKGQADIPILSSVKRTEMPKAIQNSFANVPWNTVAGSTKAAISKAIATGDWTKATRVLQFAKLGVPVPDDQQ